MTAPIPLQPQATARVAPRILAVGGGKGGIGKTLVSTNLAIELANRGKQVVIVDADLGGANVHTCLGIAPPQVSLSDFVSKRIEKIDDVAVPTGIKGLRLIGGAMDALDAANPKFAQKQKLLRHLEAMAVDHVVLDLGAGTHFNVIDFFLAADQGIAVAMPEPTSIENLYRFVKAAFFRKLQAEAEHPALQAAVETSMSARGAGRTVFQLYAELEKGAPEALEELRRRVAEFRPAVVVNQARLTEDREVGHAMVAAWRKYFGLEMDLLGTLEHDDDIWQSVRKRRPIILDRPEGQLARALRNLVDELLFLERRGSP